MKNLRFSLFGELKGVTGSFQTTPTNELSFKELIEYYNSKQNKELSLAILNEKDKAKQTKLKNKRAYYTPSGVFTKRNNTSIVHHNNIISIDIDNLESKNEALKVKEQLTKHESILFACLSVRGKGVKALMLVNKTYTPEEQYQQLKHIFKPYLANYLKLDSIYIDEAQFVLSQACYFSYDESFYINENAIPLTLDFNYKEAPRPEFKKVVVPNSANSRIEKYILKTLDNLLSKLTPQGNRHQKLFSVKYLGQILHYAPHLESQIVEAFICQGLQMYGTKSMLSNVTNSVNKAIEDGKRQPINNTIIEEIIAEQNKTKHLVKQTKSNDVEYLKTRYLSEDSELTSEILNTIKKNKFTIINAPVGIGKTTLFKTITEELNTKAYFLAPLKTIVEQQQGEFKTVLGGTPKEEIKIAKNYSLLFSTYQSAHKLENAIGKTLIIDESHLLSDRVNLLQEHLKTLYKFIAQADKVIFLSATTNKLLNVVYPKAKTINIKRENEPTKQITPYFYSKGQNDSVISWLKEQQKGVNVVFINDKQKLTSLKDEVIKLGMYKANEVSCFTSNPIDVESEDYNTLIEQEALKQGTKLILATSKISEGVNIKNKEQFNILLVGSFAKDLNLFRQVIGRFRNALSLNINVLFNEDFKSTWGKKIDENNLYNSFAEELKSYKIDLSHSNILKEQHSSFASISWRENALIQFGYNLVPNYFHLINEVKKTKESYYNYYTWCNELSSLEDISFNKPINIENKENKELTEIRKEVKAEKQSFLEDVRNNILKYIPEVYNTTKNNQLKSVLFNEVNCSSIELSIDEKILFHKYYSKVESYLTEINTIANLLQKPFTEALNIYFENEYYKKFQLHYKRLSCMILEEQEPKTLKEHITKSEIKRIKDTLKGIDTIAKNDLVKLLRSKLGYRFKAVNTQAIEDKIGCLFFVDYNKIDKVYSLKSITEYNYSNKQNTLENKNKKVIAEDFDFTLVPIDF